ncbi:MAG TPA: glutamine synthetase [Bacteroidales bacterium]|nr:MAG: glutamine synthetase [Bacteroidetes bacterium GWF2_33_38]OFY89325.1 MAG: glutamine synthetase [Bacteroidetes bacterium RIFOXYA2_FULL_33_7]HBF89252.1 glutamine synthetase [Bacteroidales bacterium]
MKESEILLSPNPLVRHLNKPTWEFTRTDIIKIVEDFDIEMLNFRYVAEDGKLKSLNFVITSKNHLETIFATGERVDGSSLFSYVEANTSDLYVIPRFKTAFLNPFTEVPTLDILCSFYNSDGLPLESAPEYILRKANREFQKATGMKFKALGELEYYIIGEKDDLFPAVDQKGYHASLPYAKFEDLRTEAMRLIAQCGGIIKYGHSEVGNFCKGEEYFEQNEIEFLPVDVEDTADQMVIAKWVLRMLGYKYGVNISFAPKITVGKAGSGLHIHMLAEKDGVNQMADDNGLTDTAKKIIAGLLDLAAPLTAFGNTIPTSYLRLVPHQEAPTNICWGDRNRSVLVRVPLGWIAKTSMIKNANPQEKDPVPYIPGKQTVELRSPDGSANVYSLLAGIVIAAQHGLEMPNSLEIAKKLYVDVNIFKDENKGRVEKLAKLPASCWESADCLQANRAYFEKKGIFPAGTIDLIISQLKNHDDKNLSEKLYGKDEQIRELVDKFMHCM